MGLSQHLFTKEQASLRYNLKFTAFSNGTIKYREYAAEMSRLDDGMEYWQDEIYSPADSEKSVNPLSEIRDDSLRRTRNILDDIILENYSEWKSFITLTFAGDLMSLTETNRLFNIYVTSVRRVMPDFKYCGVPEFQKRGMPHYHIFTNIPCGSSLLPKRKIKKLWQPKKKKYIDIEYYDIPYWKKGYSSAFDIVNEVDSKFNCSKYMKKYLYKDKDNRLFSRKKVLKSRNLNKPKIYYKKIDDKKIVLVNEILKKGTDLNEFKCQPTNKFSVPYKEITCHLGQVEYSKILEILQI